LDNSTVTRLVETLEKKDYLERRREEQDRRVVSVYLTERGEDIVALLELSEDKLGEIVLESIPEEKREQLKETLEELLWNLSREQMIGGK
jgi:DNA-binding MarR family transcriptional regulator